MRSNRREERRYHILGSSQQPVSRNEPSPACWSRCTRLIHSLGQRARAVDEVIDVTGRAAIQAALELSAQQVTRKTFPARQEAPRRNVVRWGRQPGRVKLPATANCGVSKPRLRKRSGGEVKVPAYEAIRRRTPRCAHARHSDEGRVDAQLCRGDWRDGRHGAGCRSAVSREAVEAAEKSIDEVLTRRLR